MLYTLCYQFENDFCSKFVHGEQLRLDLRNRSSRIELLSIGKKTSFFFAPFHGFKNDFALRQLFHCKKQLKKKEKNTMKTHRLMSSVREKAGLLKCIVMPCVFVFWSVEGSKHRC